MCRSAASSGLSKQRAIRRRNQLKVGSWLKPLSSYRDTVMHLCHNTTHNPGGCSRATITQSLPLILLCQGLWLWGGSSWFIRRNPVTSLVTRLPSSVLQQAQRHWLSASGCCASAFHVALPAETQPLLSDGMLTCVGQNVNVTLWTRSMGMTLLTFSWSKVKYYNFRTR